MGLFSVNSVETPSRFSTQLLGGLCERDRYVVPNHALGLGPLMWILFAGLAGKPRSQANRTEPSGPMSRTRLFFISSLIVLAAAWF
jgi:hypothetical protein